MCMRNIFCAVLISFIPFILQAQPKGFADIKNVTAFKDALAKSNASIETIASDFTQTKNLSMLSDKIKSKGKFYFKKDDKVRIEYTSPYSYLLVMNGGRLLVKDEQKTNKINTRNSKMMQSVNRIIIDCMRGSVFQNPDFKVQAFENGQHYLLSLSPVTEGMKKMFRQIDVYINKRNFDVNQLVMREQGGDYTDMDFTNTKHNVSLNETLFRVN